MTAYESNTRKHVHDSSPIKSGWAPAIDDLLKQDHCFLGFKYSDNGILFRGMSSGLLNAIRANVFGLYKDAKPHAELEQKLKVHFVSHELSDAITTARLWEDVDDAGIVVLSSQLFNQCYDEKRAAMMAFAEPGFVFKYPFFVDAIPLELIECLLVNYKTYEKLKSELEESKFSSFEKNILILNDSESASTQTNFTRADFEYGIKQIILRRDYQAAIPEATIHFPGKY